MPWLIAWPGTVYLFVIQVRPEVKYLLVVTIAMALTLAAYELVIKRVNLNLLRFCFGMKPLRPAIPYPSREAAPVVSTRIVPD